MKAIHCSCFERVGVQGSGSPFGANFEPSSRPADRLRVSEAAISRHGYLRRCVEPAIHRYLDCDIFDHGVAQVRCPGCRHEFLVVFSCKLRGPCPSCHQKRELLWADWAERELLEDVPHRQVVFTIPKRLRIFFRYGRKLLGKLAGCAWGRS